MLLNWVHIRTNLCKCSLIKSQFHYYCLNSLVHSIYCYLLLFTAYMSLIHWRPYLNVVVSHGLCTVEPISGLEPETSSLPRKCSTAELYGQILPGSPSLVRPRICQSCLIQHIVGAGDRDRTDIISLEG